jgi:hypothetical protein
MGESEHAFINPRTKKWEVARVELFFDLRHTARRYIRYAGDTAIQPLFETSGKENQVERFDGPLRKPDYSAFEPAPPDTKTKILDVPVTPENPRGRLGRPSTSAWPTTGYHGASS